MARPGGGGEQAIISHFDLLRDRPMARALDSNSDSSLLSERSVPPRVTSSRKPNLSLLESELRMGCSVRQNKSGPRGSPCLYNYNNNNSQINNY